MTDSVSVVIPCLNEAKTLAACIENAMTGIRKAGIGGEIIIADNGSTDNSVQVAESAGARVIRCARKGYGNALRAGFAAAQGSWILMGDADESYDFSRLPDFLEKIRQGYDLVMGSRIKGRIDAGAMPWLHRYIGNPVLTGILRMFFHVHISDAHCGLRAFRRDTLDRLDLRTAGMELASEMVIKAGRSGLRITEIPIDFHKDKRDRPPHLRTFRDGWRHLRYMLMMAPNWLFIGPGVSLAAIGSAVILGLLKGPLQIGQIRLDVHTMLLGMIFVLLGVYLFITGLYVKVFTFTEKLGTTSSQFTRLLARLDLEHGLILAAVLILTGFTGDFLFLLEWKQKGFGDVDVQSGMRVAILYTTLLTVGIEILFASFFLSMLGISRDTYIGKHDAA